MSALSDVLSARNKPTLFIGNGINRYRSSATSSWEELLGELAEKYGLKLTRKQADEMSYTEFFDILDLARPLEERSSLQHQFCDLMMNWQPADHHRKIVTWAQRNRTPIITVNFDENLSRSIDARIFRIGSGFTDYYPWSSYFAGQQIERPRDSFGIWHAHGMMRYSRSIRLGLTDYMGSVQRARTWVYGKKGLRANAKNSEGAWIGKNTWLEILFFNPIAIFGFTFGKDENFLRWLFLERARLHKIRPEWSAQTWYFDVQKDDGRDRRPFFDGLGMKYVKLPDYRDIYDDPVWLS